MAARADSTGAPAMPLAPISTNIIHFNRGRCPEGVEPRTWRKTLRHRIRQHLDVAEALLRLVDDMDGDCDLEDGGDTESSLGGLELWGQVDLEAGDVNDEPHDADLDMWEGGDDLLGGGSGI